MLWKKRKPVEPDLETRVSRLEGEVYELSADLLTALNRATAQLKKMRAAEMKRLERETRAEDAPGSTIEGQPTLQYPPLRRNLRGW